MNQNLTLFQEMISCDQKIYTWIYSNNGSLMDTNCSATILNTLFRSTGCLDYMLEYAKGNWQPLILSAPLGIMWCVSFQHTNNSLEYAYVLGPVFNTEMSVSALDIAMKRHKMSLTRKKGLKELLLSLPIVDFSQLTQYVLMLHYCLTGKKLSRGDIQYQEQSQEYSTEQLPLHNDRYKTWLVEQELLRNVRDGNLNYQVSLDNASIISRGIPASNGNPISQAVISCIVFTSLCTRESIQGGLSPEIAYTCGDNYIQRMLNCKTISELVTLNHKMYDDFIHKVVIAKTALNYSPQVRSCLDYIDISLECDITLQELAERTGYTEYYLSRKFKQEIGVTISQYIKNARIERAKILLTTTNTSIQAISDQLRFCASSYFSDCFKEIVGVSPQTWRDTYKKW